LDEVHVDLGEGRGRIDGHFVSRFVGVAREFERNFRERDEVGASVCIQLGGETVLDLWGGKASRDADTPWERDTVCVVFSCTKGATAMCAHILASRGELDIEAPVAEYWPEFATNGKEAATVRMLLDHSVGLPAWREPMKELGCTDWDYMTGRLADEEPFWEPGTRNGYHMISFGWTVGEIVRRVSGKSLGTFFRQEIAEPLGADFWIGIPPEVEERVAPVIPFVLPPGEEPGEFGKAILADRNSIQALSLANNGGFNPNSPECHAAEIGGGGGIGNARSLATIYAPFACGGSLGGRQYVDTTTLARMARVSSATNRDATLLIPTRWALGFMRSMDNRRRPFGGRDSVILGAYAFGHVGAGGSIGFADPSEDLSFGYAMNRMGQGILLNERGQSLVDATYRALGCTGNESGDWVR
jgi:CubicO group peptidase (beta-lactamase class C family)